MAEKQCKEKGVQRLLEKMEDEWNDGNLRLSGWERDLLVSFANKVFDLGKKEGQETSNVIGRDIDKEAT